jgi:hypothetical protein
MSSLVEANWLAKPLERTFSSRRQVSTHEAIQRRSSLNMACDRVTTHKSTDDNAPVCFVFNYSANAATAAEETEAVTGQAHGATARHGGEERPRALLVDAAILLMRRARAQVRLAKG